MKLDQEGAGLRNNEIASPEMRWAAHLLDEFFSCTVARFHNCLVFRPCLPLHALHALHAMHALHALQALHALHTLHALHALHGLCTVHALHAPHALHALHTLHATGTRGYFYTHPGVFFLPLPSSLCPALHARPSPFQSHDSSR